MHPLKAEKKLIIGVCAMESKARSKPMRNLLSRLLEGQLFDVVNFGDHVILEEPIEQWPKCDIFISFFSSGFPLHKAIAYSRLNNVYSVNDLLMQELLFDRRTVLAILDAIDVPTPRRMIINRDHPNVSHEALMVASRDFGIYFEVSLNKGDPIVVENQMEYEGQVLCKPFVEKPTNAEDHNINIYYENGKGGRRLFRKIENKSSEYDPNLSDIRQDGRSYIYEEFLNMDNAEDVKVYTIGPYHTFAETRRSPSITGVVKRNSDGKEIRKITKLSDYEQDIARRICMAFGQTICGFDMLRVNGKSYVIDVNGWSFVKGSEEYDDLCARVLTNIFSKIVRPKMMSHVRNASLVSEDHDLNHWVLKGYINVLRHADRTPKLKYKMVVESNEFAQMSSISDPQEKLEYVLMETQRIVQKISQENLRYQKLKMLEEVLKQKMHNPSTKAQTRPLKDGTTMLIIKWGGEFTHAGRHQARELGETIRKDLQVLNKKSFENIKVYCSVERRVQATADVFVKGFLKIAEVPSNAIVSRPDLLDQASAAKDSLEQVKSKVSFELNKKRQGTHLNMNLLMEQFSACLQQLRDRMASSFQGNSLYRMMMFRWCCSESPSLFRERWEKHFRDLLGASFIEPARISDLYDSLKYDAIHHREFLEYVFKVDENSQILRTLYSTTQQLFAYLSPQETGTSSSEKTQVGLQIIRPLLIDILDELNSLTEESHTKTRFYFTKESHMVALYNVLVHSGLPMSRDRTASILFPEELTKDKCWYGELDYLSQICFELYEKRTLDDQGHVKKVFSLRIGMSQGAHDSHLLDLQLDERHFLSVAPKRWITPYINGVDAIETLLKAVNN